MLSVATAPGVIVVAEDPRLTVRLNPSAAVVTHNLAGAAVAANQAEADL